MSGAKKKTLNERAYLYGRKLYSDPALSILAHRSWVTGYRAAIKDGYEKRYLSRKKVRKDCKCGEGGADAPQEN